MARGIASVLSVLSILSAGCLIQDPSSTSYGPLSVTRSALAGGPIATIPSPTTAPTYRTMADQTTHHRDRRFARSTSARVAAIRSGPNRSPWPGTTRSGS